MKLAERPRTRTDTSRCLECGRETGPPMEVLGIEIRRSYCDVCVEKREQELEEAERLLLVNTLHGAANLPPAADGWTFEQARVENPKPAEEVEKWRYGPEGLFLHGPAGSGKTILAWCLLNREIVENCRPVLFVSVPDLLYELRIGFEGRGRGIDWLVRARDTDLLVLDDLGAERPTEWAREQVLGVINHRVNHRRPTIITSNYSPRQLFDRLGDETGRLVDRIVGNCRVVEVMERRFRLERYRRRNG